MSLGRKAKRVAAAIKSLEETLSPIWKPTNSSLKIRMIQLQLRRCLRREPRHQLLPLLPPKLVITHVWKTWQNQMLLEWNWEWDETTMYTRTWNLFYPPDWFIKELPANMALDGEFWTKRDDFQNSVSIVRRQDKNDEWRDRSPKWLQAFMA